MRPRLIRPQLVTVEPIDRSRTRYDSLAEEPRGAVAYGAAIVLRCQVDVRTENRRASTQGGAVVRKEAQLTFLRADVDAAGWSPQDGDRITRVAALRGSQARTVNWRIVDPHEDGISDSGGTLVIADAELATTQRVQHEGV